MEPESIQSVTAGAVVSTFDDKSAYILQLEKSHVTQTHTTPNRDVLSLHGTKVTPGHSFLTPDGNFAQIGDILLNDGFIVDEHGDVFRARTREKVDENTWKLYHAFDIRMAAPAGGWAAWSAARGYTAEGVADAFAGAAGLPLPSEAREMAFAGVGDTGPAAADVVSAAQLIDGEFPFLADDGYVLPYAGRETVYNITVADTHTYIADGWRVHNDSLPWRQAGSQIGGLFAGQLFEHFGNDNVALGLAVGVAGRTLGGVLGGEAYHAVFGGSAGTSAEGVVENFGSGLVSAGVGHVVNYGVSKLTDQLFGDSEGGQLAGSVVGGIASLTLTTYISANIAVAAGTAAPATIAASQSLSGAFYAVPVAGWITLAATIAKGFVAGSPRESWKGQVNTHLLPSIDEWVANPGRSAVNVLDPHGTAIFDMIGRDSVLRYFSIGGFFGGLFDQTPSVGPNGIASYVFDPETGQFQYSSYQQDNDFPIGTLNGIGDGLQTFSNTLADVVGGKLVGWDGPGVASGNSSVRYNSSLGGWSWYHDGAGATNVSSANEAIQAVSFSMLKNMKIEGGDLYIKRLLRNGTYAGSEISDKFQQDTGIATAFGTYRDNEAGFLAGIDLLGAETSVEWREQLVRAAELNLDIADARDFEAREGYSEDLITSLTAFDDFVGPLYSETADPLGDIIGLPPEQNFLVLDLDGDGLSLVPESASETFFDMDNDGYLEQTAWVTARDGLLVWDRNRDGQINNATEVFSSFDDPDGDNASLTLAELDSNVDGKVNSDDTGFAQIRVWTDINQDGVVGIGELHALHRFGITAFATGSVAAGAVLNGNQVVERGLFSQIGWDSDFVGGVYEVKLFHDEFGTGAYTGDDTTHGQIDFEDGGSLLTIDSDAGDASTTVIKSSVTDIVEAGAGNETISVDPADAAGLVTISGGAGDDVITGGDGNDILGGGDGADRVSGGAGDDFITADEDDFFDAGGNRLDIDGVAGIGQGDINAAVSGGAGNDSLDLTQVDSGLTMDVDAAGFETVLGGQGDDTFTTSGTETVTIAAGDGDDSVTGSVGDDQLEGNAGDDTLTGGAGDDILAGGAGRDTIHGGAGDDQLVIDAADLFDALGVADQTGVSGGAGDDTLVVAGDEGVTFNLAASGIEDAVGGSGDDDLTGGDGVQEIDGGFGDDRLTGGKGDDVIEGGFGDDTAVFSGSRGDYEIAWADGVLTVTDQRVGEDGTDTVTGVEHLYFEGDSSFVHWGDFMPLSDGASVTGVTETGTARDDVLDGTEHADDLSGGAGNDTLSGGEGVDVLRGGDGDDVLSGGDGDEAVLEGGAGDDAISGGAGDDALDGGAGDDALDGGEGDDTLTGGAGDDVFFGAEGDDVIHGGDGAEDVVQYAGVLGDYALSYDGVTDTVTVTDLSGADGDEGTDTVHSDVETLEFGDTEVSFADLKNGTAKPAVLNNHILLQDGMTGTINVTPSFNTLGMSGAVSVQITLPDGMSANAFQDPDSDGIFQLDTAQFSGGEQIKYTVTRTDGGNTYVSEEGTILVEHGAIPYEIENVADFDGAGDVLTQTPGSIGNRSTFTFSAWVKRDSIDSQQTIFSAADSFRYGNGYTDHFGYLRFEADNTLRMVNGHHDDGVNDWETTSTFDATDEWLHIVWQQDNTQESETARMRLWVNGVEETSFTRNSTADRFGEGTIGTLNAHTIGDGLDAQVGDVRFFDGRAVAADDLGQFVNGDWQPAGYTDYYGQNDFHLDFKNEAAQSTDVPPLATGYSLPAAIDFDGTDDYLSMAPANAGNRRTWTWSGWVKRGGGLGSHQVIFGAGVQSGTDTENYLAFGTGNQLRYHDSSSNYGFYTTQTFTDTDAWHHVVLSVDSTQTVESDRVKLYVDGSRVTSFASETYLPQDHESGGINTTLEHRIGQHSHDTTDHYFNGNLADVHFVDGAALAANDFGIIDSGNWSATTFTGTYGANGYRLDFGNAGNIGDDVNGNNDFSYEAPGRDDSARGNDWTASGIAINEPVQMSDVPPVMAGYSLTASASFDGVGDHLSQTPSVAGDRKTWTASYWVKPGSAMYHQGLSSSDGSTNNNISRMGFGTDNKLILQEKIGGTEYKIRSTQTFTDTDAWYHLVFVWDSTNATQADRLRFYVNGDRITDLDLENQPTVPTDGNMNSAQTKRIGSVDWGAPIADEFYDIRMADVHFVDGVALDASSFGTANGPDWVATEYTGDHGDNGFHLDFADAGDLGNDANGDNDFATDDLALLTNNIAVGGTAGDDHLVGLDDEDVLVGGSGDDVIDGGAGDDFISGGAGADDLSGGDGVDTLSYAGSRSGVAIDLNSPTSAGDISGNTGPASDASGDTISGFENVIGSDHADVLEGDSGENILLGGAGDDTLRSRGGGDTLDGGAGEDTVSYDDQAAGVTVDLGLGRGETAGGEGSISGIENVTGSGHSDSLAGDFGDNTLDGGAGDDELFGGAGDDTLIGGAGTDTVVYTGNLAEYHIWKDGTDWKVKHLATTVADEGVDTLTGVETVQFADMSIDLSVTDTAPIALPGRIFVEAGQSIDLNLRAFDPDGGAVTFGSLVTTDAGGGTNVPTLDSQTGVLTFDATGVAVGTYSVEFGVTDDELNVSSPQTVEIVVHDGTLPIADASANGLAPEFAASDGDASTVPSYRIDNSVSFDGTDDYLSATPGSAGDRKTWTFSTWVKRDTTGSWEVLFGAGDGGSAEGIIFGFNSDNELAVQNYSNVSSATLNMRLVTNRTFTDTDTWHHIVLSVDTTQATDSDRVKMFVDGVEETSFAVSSWPVEDLDTAAGANWEHQIGKSARSSGDYLDGQMADVRFVDGQALGADSFGTANDASEWVPADYTGSYGDNGFHLSFADDGDLGNDASGSGGTAVAHDAGTIIGNMTSTTWGGAITKAFDGVTSGASGPGVAALGAPSAGQAATIGKDWGTGITRVISGFDYQGSNNTGIAGGTTVDIEVRLEGSNDGFASEVVELYSGTHPEGASSQLISIRNGVDTSTAYRYHRIAVETVSGTPTYYEVAEVTFVEAGNDFTAVNAPEQGFETPSYEYAVLDAASAHANVTVSGDDLEVSASASGYFWTPSTDALESGGKWAFEAQRTAGTWGYVGIVGSGQTSGVPGSNSIGINVGNGEIVHDGSVVTTVTVPGSGVVRVEYDVAADAVEIFVGGTSVYTSSSVGLTGPLHFGVAAGYGSTLEANFGANGFAGTPTAGFEAQVTVTEGAGAPVTPTGSNQSIEGGSGADTLDGDDGHDVLSGDDGADDLTGGAGNDFVGGGAGDDVYRFGVGSGSDVFEDLNRYEEANNESYDVSHTFVYDYRIRQQHTDTDSEGFQYTYYEYPLIEDATYTKTESFSLASTQTVTADGGSDTLDLGTVSQFDHTTDIAFSRAGSDLVLDLGGGDVVRLRHWFTETGGVSEQRIETLKYNDGTSDITVDLTVYVPGLSLVDGAGEHDTIEGDEAANVLEGGAGDDWLDGGAGDDVYVYNRGDGVDVIHDDHWADETYELPYSYSDVTLSHNYDTWQDGQVIGSDVEGNEILGWAQVSFPLSETLSGDGTVSVTDYRQQDGGTDTLRLGPGIGLSDLRLAVTGPDVVLGIADRANPSADFKDLTDTIRLRDWSNEKNRIEFLQLADGTLINLAVVLDGVTDTAGIITIPASHNGVAIGGTDQDDVISGGAGDDTINGGAGHDTILASPGSDTIDGGAGIDEVVIDGLSTDYDITVNADGSVDISSDAPGGGTETSQLSNVERIRFLDRTVEIGGAVVSDSGNGTYSGTAHADIFAGTGAAETFEGNGGSDVFEFGIGSGTDTIDLAGSTAAVRLGPGIGADDLVFTASGDDLLLQLVGVADTLTVSGWFATDSTVPNDVRIVLSTGQIVSPIVADFVGSGANDTHTATDDGELVVGMGGADTLTGGAGDDTLVGGAGDDVLTGGAGNDTFVFGSGAGHDTVSDSDGVDELRIGLGLTRADLAFKIDGNDLIVGLITDSTAAVVFGNLVDTVRLQGWLTAATRVETIRLSNGDVLEVSDIAARLGTDEADTVTWTETAASLQGRDGNDSLTGGDENDVLDGGAGNDTLVGAAGDDILAGGDGNDNLTAGDGNDLIDGGAGDDVLSGGAGDDLLQGGAGSDTIDGGEGIDTISYNTSEAEVSATLETGNATVTDGGSTDTDTITNIENIVGSAHDDTLTGDAAHNRIEGGDGHDTIEGAAGHDTLLGGRGDDQISGGTGSDVLIGGGGDDTYKIGLFGDHDIIRHSNGAGTLQFTDSRLPGVAQFSQVNAWDLEIAFSADDTVTVRNFFFDGSVAGDNPGRVSFEDNTGQALVFDLDFAGTVADDFLFGGAGDDVIEGGAGADFIDGRAGFDTVSFANSLTGVTIDLNDTNGDGSVFAAGSDGFGDQLVNIEAFAGSNLADSLTGSDGEDALFGLDGADTLDGDDGHDVLSGDDGADDLTGGAGNDFVGGGAGDDVYRFGVGSGSDVFEDLNRYEEANNESYDVSHTFVYDYRIRQQHTDTDSEGFQYTYYEYPLIEDATYTKTESFSLASTQTVTADGGSDTLDLGTVSQFDHTTDIAFSRAGSDLVLDLGGGDVVRLRHWFTETGGVSEQRIETLKYNDGTSDITVDLTVYVPGLSLVDGAGEHDTIEGDEAANVLEGGAGDDWLDGGAGDDVYVYNRGDGVDVIHDDHWADETYELPYSYSDVTLSHNYDTWQDGQVIGSDVEGNEILGWAQVSFPLSETLSGDGTVSVTDYRQQDGGTDTLRLGPGIGLGDIGLSMSGRDLIVGIYGIGDANKSVSELDDTIRIKDWHNVNTRVENIEIENGDGTRTAVSLSALLALGAGPYSLQDLSGQIDISVGASGDDTLSGTSGRDLLDGGFGNDTLHGHDGDDILIGGDGADILGGGDGADALNGGAGNDTLTGGAGADILDGGAGRDRASYTGSGAGVTVSLVTGTGVGGGAEGDQLISIEDINGSGFNDTLTGDSGDNLLIGNDGDDVFVGGAGHNYIVGGAGVDEIDYSGVSSRIYVDLNGDWAQENGYGSYPGDWDRIYSVENIHGSDHNDVIIAKADSTVNSFWGGAGDDVLEGRGGADILDGGTGTDSAQYFSSLAGVTITLASGAATGVGGDAEGDQLIGIENLFGSNAGNDVLTGDAGANTLVGYGGDDTLNGGAGIDNLQGGSGNDRLDGGAGDDTMAGGTGDDTYVVDSTGDTVTEWNGEGTDTVEASISHSLAIYTENLTLTGTANINGTGNGESNVLIGNSGDNTLTGGGGADTLDGGDGDDTLVVDQDDIFDGVNQRTLSAVVQGGAGHDVLDMSAVTGDVILELEAIGVEEVIGGSGNDRLVGGAGADVLNGGGGADTAWYYGSAQGVTVSLVSGVVGVGGEAAGDTLVDIERIVGSNFDDVLTGDGIGNRLDGYDGDDKFIGGGGQDYIVGGAGTDEIDYSNVSARVHVALDNIIAWENGEGSWDRIYTVENIRGSAFDDLIGGDDSINQFWGGAGNDTLTGRGGADVLDGGAGRDRASYFDSGTGVTVSLVSGVVGVGGDAAGDQLSNIEDISGSNFADHLSGDSGANRLDGYDGDDVFVTGDGQDYIDGGAGTDEIDYTNALQRVYVDLGNDWAQENGYGTDADDWDRIYNVENITGSDYNDVIIAKADSTVNSFWGGAGDDVLEGRGGADILDGGTGTDSAQYFSSLAGVTITLASGAATGVGGDAEGDQLIGIENLFGSNAGNDVLTGDAGANTLVGYGGDDTLNGGAGIDNLQGGSGNDRLDGGAGDDTMAGGTGDDTYVVDSTGDTVTEWNGEGTDTVEASISHSLAIYTENLTLTGTANINGTGNGESNVLIGNSGNNTLTGGGAADTLTGGAGNDTLVGGTGDDTYTFNRGDDADIVDNAGETTSGDKVLFGSTIDHDQLWFEQVGNDLKVSVIGTTDSVTVDEWFTGTSNRLDFEGGDTYTLSDANVQALVDAMSTFSPPAIGETEFSQSATDYSSVTSQIASSWQA